MVDLDAFADDLQARIISDAREIYSEEVVRRWLDTPSASVMHDPDSHARVTGPCGDTMEVFLRVKEGCVSDASFVTDGCAASIACGSVVCDLALGKPAARLREVTQEAILEVLGGLPEADMHCALLAARTLDETVHDWTVRDEQQEEEK